MVSKTITLILFNSSKAIRLILFNSFSSSNILPYMDIRIYEMKLFNAGISNNKQFYLTTECFCAIATVAQVSFKNDNAFFCHQSLCTTWTAEFMVLDIYLSELKRNYNLESCSFCLILTSSVWTLDASKSFISSGIRSLLDYTEFIKQMVLFQLQNMHMPVLLLVLHRYFYVLFIFDYLFFLCMSFFYFFSLNLFMYITLMPGGIRDLRG